MIIIIVVVVEVVMVLVIVGDEQKMACEIYQMPSVSCVQTCFFLRHKCDRVCVFYRTDFR